MKSLVVSAGLALGLLGFADTASAQVIISPGYGWGGGYYQPVYPAYGWGGYRPYYAYPRTAISVGYGNPGWGYGYGRPWGWGAPGWGGGWGAPGWGGGWGGRPGVSFGLTFIR